MAIKNVAMNAYMNALQGPGHANKVRTGQSGTLNKVGKEQGASFSNTLNESLGRVNDLQSEKSAMIQEFASGERQNVHELMISLQKAGLAMRMTSAVRNKVMEAYKELSHMSF